MFLAPIIVLSLFTCFCFESVRGRGEESLCFSPLDATRPLHVCIYIYGEVLDDITSGWYIVKYYNYSWRYKFRLVHCQTLQLTWHATSFSLSLSHLTCAEDILDQKTHRKAQYCTTSTLVMNTPMIICHDAREQNWRCHQDTNTRKNEQFFFYCG